MQFRRKVELGAIPIAVSLSPEVTQKGPGFKVEGMISVDGGDEESGIKLRGGDEWICDPAYIPINQKTDFTILGKDQDIPIQITAEEFVTDSTKTVIEFPPLSLLKAAQVCAAHDIDRLPPQIDRIIDRDTDNGRCIAFIEWISTVTFYEDYLSILEQLATISPGFRHSLAQGIEKQLQRMLTGRNYNAEFTIETYDDFKSRIEDFEELTPIQRLSKEVNIQRALLGAIREVKWEQGIDGVAKFCRALKLPIHHPTLLNSQYIDAVLAQQLIDDDLNGVWDTVTHTIAPLSDEVDESYEKIKERALDTDDFEKKRDLWQKSLLIANGDSDVTLSLSNYLYWTARTQYDDQLLTCALLYKAAERGFLQYGVEYMAQHAGFNHYFTIGQYHISNSEYSESTSAFQEAFSVAIDTEEFSDELPKQCAIATRFWGISSSNDYRYQRNYEDGIEVVTTAMSDLKSHERFSEIQDDIQADIAQLRAQQRILEMEQYLTQSEYELALETAGAVVREYARIDEQDSQRWAITKRKEIQAIIFETNGDLNQAANLHRKIGDSGRVTDGRRKWHIHRGDICDAKQLALEGRYHEAQKQLSQIRDRTNRLESEAKDLSIVLDAIIAYEADERTPFSDSLNQLSPSEHGEDDHEPMRLEYNYEDPLSVIHAAQWLRTYNVDTEVLNMSVEVALQASLIPLHAGDAAATVGLDEVSLRDQWLTELPGPIAQRITQIQLDQTMPQTDYSGLGSRLFSLLELYLAMYGEYYSAQKWGEEWRSNLSDADKSKDLALGDLTNIFKKCNEMLNCSETVDNLISGGGAGQSVTKLRNDIGHAKTDDLRRDEYTAFRDRVLQIFEESADESPVLGRAIETRGQGEFQVELVQLKWWRPQRRVFIKSDFEFEGGELYYFPHDLIDDATKQGSIQIPSGRIIRVKTERVSTKFEPAEI